MTDFPPPIICPVCKTEFQDEPSECSHCGYPFAAPQEVRSKYFANQILKKGHISDAKSAINRAQIILFLISIISFLAAFIYKSKVSESSTGINIILAFVFLIFAFIVKKLPMISVVIPLVLLLLIYTTNAIVEPATLFIGILWKIVYLSSLIYAVFAISKAERIRKENAFLATKNYK